MLRWPVGFREERACIRPTFLSLSLSLSLSLFHAAWLVRVLTRSPGSGAAKSRGIRTNPERSRSVTNTRTNSRTRFELRANYQRVVSASLSLSFSLLRPFPFDPLVSLSLWQLVCIFCRAAPSADVSINSGTRRPSRLISIHSPHTYSMCHEIIGR